ncbi:MAG: PKD domain-containing protein [Bacteroidota bacterium]
MKNKLLALLTLIICLAFTSVYGQKKFQALFLGNSYTYVNDLPNMLKQLALSKGDTLITDQNTPGGYTLQLHSTDATSLAKINAAPWDFVILQEQSQLPAFPPSQVAAEVYPFADSLNKYIRKNDTCSQIVFFMTWGRKNGDATNCASYPPICTYEGMQAGLRQSYLHMGQTLDALVSPVGMVWKKVRNEGDSINLYNADESHPSLAGSYLAACTFYATMFQKSPLGAYVPAGLNPYTAMHLQQYALQVVFDSLAVWNIDTTHVKASFSTTLNQNVVGITNQSQNADSYFWDFGDGQSQSGSVANHTYASIGDYLLKLIAFRGCSSDTITQTIYVSVVGITAQDQIIRLHLFPVPTTEFLFIEMESSGMIYDFTVFNALGSEVLRGKDLKSSRIDISTLQNGMYYIRLEAESGHYSGKFQVLK